ncbi:MAG: hypothetical protein ABH836_07295 [Candidatus Omnitrophota bacterium]
MRSKFSKKIVFALLCGFLMLQVSGCATYQALSLPMLSREFAPYSAEQNGVTLSCKAFTKSDCKAYLGRDVIKKGYQPVHIAVDNETKSYLLFSLQGVGLPCVPPEEVAAKVHTSTLGRAATYGVAGLFVWPFLIPAIVDGVGSAQANQVLDTDFAAKGTKEQVIQPYSSMNGIIFVPVAEYKEKFTVTIFDKETKEKIAFNVICRK